MSRELYQIIPGLEAAVARECRIREQSFLGLPDRIAGIDVPRLTLRHVSWLTQAGSPFVTGGRVTPYDVGAFFLALTEARGWRRWWLLRRLSLMDGPALVKAVEAYLEEQFQDAPPRAAGEPVSYYSGQAGLVDLFASEYGWSADTVLDEPVQRLFQYLKAIKARRNPGAIQFNPSDSVRGRWLKEQNALAGRN